jgi:hypothetical protein
MHKYVHFINFRSHLLQHPTCSWACRSNELLKILWSRLKGTISEKRLLYSRRWTILAGVSTLAVEMDRSWILLLSKGDLYYKYCLQENSICDSRINPRNLKIFTDQSLELYPPWLSSCTEQGPDRASFFSMLLLPEIKRDIYSSG